MSPLCEDEKVELLNVFVHCDVLCDDLLSSLDLDDNEI